MHIKKGDTVKILSGDDKGKTGKVARAFPAIGKIIIEDMNTVKRHEKSRKQGVKGQMVTKSMPMHASKVAKIE
jgi:large subunit ribosomal protein L24